VAITHVKIHPAIGVARVGNSPSSWFWGPEYPGERPGPPFKDERCRVKKQAARFRLFAYHDDGPPTVLTSADGEIRWRVRVANAKVRPRLDSGVQVLNGPTPGRLLEGTVVIGPRRCRWAPARARWRRRCGPSLARRNTAYWVVRRCG
jgi:hypothetical protein